MAQADHWYEVVSTTTLRQGDILRDLVVRWFSQDLPILRSAPGVGDSIPTEWSLDTWIVMSASCDVDRDPGFYPNVLIGRILPATKDNLKEPKDRELKKRLDVIRKGLEPSKFLLSEYPNIAPEFPLSFVQFPAHLTVPMNYLKRACTVPRLRLKHPFRESFGTWVGTNFARVGPEDHMSIAPFSGGTFPGDVLKANEE